MSKNHSSSSGGVSSPAPSTTHTRLHGYWLVLARMVWIALVILVIGFVVVGLPEYIAQLYTVSNNLVYVPWQLSPEGFQALQNAGISLSVYAPFAIVLSSAIMLVWVVVGAVIFWRKSNDWMALLVAFVLVYWGVSTFAATVTLYPGNLALQIAVQAGGFLLTASSILFFFLFPDGRFVPGWIRWLAIVAITLEGGAQYFFPDSLFNPSNWPAPFNSLSFIILFVSIAGAQIYRYRRVANAVQREQIKWVVFALTIVVLGIVGDVVVEDLLKLHLPVLLTQLLGPVTFNLVPVLIPVSIGIAILRSRLYDIDIIINRTLVYGTLTVILTAVYVGLVIGLQALLRGIISQDSSVAIVISTLAIAALFQPLRYRIQRVIDRRFYRSKYDAAKIVAAFSATLRQEVDLDQLREHLVAVVEETMQPAHVSLWLRPTQHDGERSAWGAHPLSARHTEAPVHE
jgi:hypothetical protein